MDPYKVLNVSRNCSIEQLRDAFKQVAIKVHPDKGGNQELFNIVVESYKVIFQKLKGQSGDRDFNELKQESQREFTTMKKTKHVSFKLDDDKEGFQKKFNKVFDDNNSGTNTNVTNAINQSINDSVSIVNLSLGFDNQVSDVRSKLVSAKNNDILTLSASGNDTADNPMHPAFYASDPDLQNYILSVGDQDTDLTHSMYGVKINVL